MIKIYDFIKYNYGSHSSKLIFDEKIMSEEDDFIKEYCQLSGNLDEDNIFYFLNKDKEKAEKYVHESIIFYLLNEQKALNKIIEKLRKNISDLTIKVDNMVKY
jgi:hypothetical protein